MAKRVKANIEFLLVKAEIKGVPEKCIECTITYVFNRPRRWFLLPSY